MFNLIKVICFCKSTKNIVSKINIYIICNWDKLFIDEERRRKIASKINGRYK